MAEEESEVTVDEDVPENFAAQIARDVMVIFQKQMDPENAAVEACAYIWKNTGTSGKVGYFVDATEMWLETQATGEKYAALSWLAIANQSANNEEYETFLHMMINSIIKGYYNLEKPDIEYKGKKYSTYTSIVSNIFIRMQELNPTFGEIAANIFSILIRNEMELSAKSQFLSWVLSTVFKILITFFGSSIGRVKSNSISSIILRHLVLLPTHCFATFLITFSISLSLFNK